MSQVYHIEPKPIYPLIAIDKVEFLNNYNGREGTFIKGFLMNDQRNKNGWRVTWDSIKQYGSDFINHPGTYYEIAGIPDHPEGETYLENMSNQELSRVTNIVGVEVDEEKRQLNYIAEILPSELSEMDFKQMLNDAKINYTSPGIWPEEFEVMGITETGKPALDVSKWRALHYSYINDPAYGKDTALTIGTCEGEGIACSMQLAAKLTAQNESPLAPLQEVELIRRKLNSMYKSCEIAKMHASLVTAQDSECVSNKLKIVMQDNPEMPKDQQLAISYAFCRQQGVEELYHDIKNDRDVDIGY